MNLSISPLRNNINFTQQNKTSTRKVDSLSQNPISKTGERMNLVKATFAGGLAVGLRLLAEIWDSQFLIDTAGDIGEKLVEKNKKNLTPNKKLLLTLGATAGIVAAGVSAFALLYTIFNAPKIAYDGKVNAFQKSKDMDVYIKGNEIEKELYTDLAEKSKNASDVEKRELAQQYLLLKSGKNKLPDFIKM